MSNVTPIQIQPWPLPNAVPPANGNPGIVPPWLQREPKSPLIPLPGPKVPPGTTFGPPVYDDPNDRDEPFYPGQPQT